MCAIFVPIFFLSVKSDIFAVNNAKNQEVMSIYYKIYSFSAYFVQNLSKYVFRAWF